MFKTPSGHRPHVIRIIIEMDYTKKPAPWAKLEVERLAEILANLGTGATKVTVYEEPKP